MRDTILGQGKVSVHYPLAHSEFFIDCTLNPIYHHSNPPITLQNLYIHLIYHVHAMCTMLGTMLDAGNIKNKYNVTSAQKEFIVFRRRQPCKQ